MNRATALRLAVITFVAIYPLQLLVTMACGWWLGSPWWGLLTIPAGLVVGRRISRWARP